ncbi:MAG: ABC transporter ATP-binding protein [Candidatus Thorarchaeota archaeon]
MSLLEADISDENILSVRHLVKYFPLAKGFFANLFNESIFVRAVDDISFDLRRGEILVIAGESGCGKTTTGKTVIRLLKPTSGEIWFKEEDIAQLPNRHLKRLRTAMSIIFQDPYESLNPKISIYNTVAEPLRLNKLAKSKDEEIERIAKALSIVKLGEIEQYLDRFPHELSGGQRQRVSIARALTLEPELIVADEPVSMLDVSIRAEILNLLLEQRKNMGISYVFVTHDLAVAAYIGDRIAIMYLGKIIELGDVKSVVERSRHHYTEALLSAVPSSDPSGRRRRKVLTGEPPSPINPPPGCRFHPRCPAAQERCMTEEPPLELIGKDHLIACFYPIER